MFIDNFGDITAIGFDIDGTLYENWKLNVRVAPTVLRHLWFFINYSKTRKIMHTKENLPDFHKAQNQLMADLMHCSPEKAEQLQDKIVYSGMSKHFNKITPCKGAVELIKDLKAAGYKIALLSDFPPEQKGEIWGIKPYCDVILGTAETGALKPAALPFEKMAEALGVPANQILYVGNSMSKDVRGSMKAGMKSAWFASRRKCRYTQRAAKADFCFWNYEQLRKLLLKKK